MKEYRVCVTRYGYATVQAKDRSDLDDKVNQLNKDDFDWEPVTDDVIGAYEVAEERQA